MLEKIIADRYIPPLPDIADAAERHEYMKKVLSAEEYGDEIPKPDIISFEKQEVENSFYMGGKGVLEEIRVTLELMGKEFSFPFKFVYKRGAKNQRPIVHVNFRSLVPDKYLPAEELIDRGFAVAQICYSDISSDSTALDGIAEILFPRGERTEPSAPGKIRMWAWGASRVADYLETLDFVDMDMLAVAGHSRLGKTALVAAAYDDRFKLVHSNDSGCCGGAIARDKRGERIEDIIDKFPYWFCPRLADYVRREHEMPFDQHWLVALVAPRYAELGTAEGDVWADHESEYLTCISAGAEYERQGLVGFVHPDRFPELDEHMNEGHISYYVREGMHFFSRYDWNKFADFIDLKTEKIQ